MKTIYIFLLSTFICYTNASNIELTVSSSANAKMSFCVLLSNITSEKTKKLAATIKKDLNFTDQFNPTIHIITDDSKKELVHALKNLSSHGTPLALYIDINEDTIITWRLYDTLQGTVINKKKYKPHEKGIVRGWAHAIADDVMKILTGNEGFFSSRVVYCKECKTDKNAIIKHIYIADYDGSHKELLVDTPTITVAPHWNNDQYNPTVFYSEYTDTNVQLMTVDMHKNKKIASNLDGITMPPSFSPDGTSVVYCATHGKGHCQLYYQKKDSPVRPLTNNNGNNTTPIFIDNDHVCFCSDFQTKSPQIYIGNLQTGHIKRITKGGYCTSPNYCPKSNSIAYHMKVNNVMQIFVYNITSKTHTQITHGPDSKHEVSWSPDGTHLLFAQEQEVKSRITAFNISTKKLYSISSEHDNCSYPHWSPHYKTFPTIIHKTDRQFVII